MLATRKQPKGNIVDYLFEHWHSSDAGSRTFLTLPTGDVSVAQLYASSCQVGGMLKSLNIGVGDRVLFSVLDGKEFPSIFLGAMKIGAVSLPINTFLTAKDYGYYIKNSDARVVIVDESLAPMIAQAIEEHSLLVKVLVIGKSLSGFDSFEDAIRDQPKELNTEPRHPDDTAFWLYSSGSTGDPKGVVHTHAHAYWSTELFGIGTLGMNADDVILCPLKMFFAFGLGFQNYMSLRVGARIIADPSPARAERILAQLIDHEPTLFVGVPTLFASLIELMRAMDPMKIKRACHRLRFCISGGEVLAPSLIAAWRDLTGTEILDGVGTTEMTHMFMINRPGGVVPGSCGRLVEGYLARLVDDNWNDVASGEVGNLFVSGPSAATQYWNKPEKTSLTMRNGGVLTGDKFFQDVDGNFFYVGRNDDMLRSGGIWISPAEIESTLLEHSEVMECAVIGVEDENKLVKPKAFIVLKPKSSPGRELEEALRQVVRSKLAHYKCPRWIVFVNDLPKTATGKIQRFKLRQMEVESTRRESATSA